MKKIITLIVMLAVAVGMMSACQNAGSGSESGSETGSVTEAGSDITVAAEGESQSNDNETAGSETEVTDTDTQTVAVSAVVIVADTVPEEAVYNFVSTIYENAAEVTEQNAKGSELDLEFASSVTAVPYHSGAAKYFEEKGFPVYSVKEVAAADDSANLTFGTGSETGTYYAYGGVLGQFVSGRTDINITVVASTGSQNNIEELSAGNIQLGFTQSDVMSYAYNGERLFESPIKNFSVVCALYMEQVQIVTTDPSIKSVADLAGKKVSIGASGSGVYFNAIDCLNAYGLDEDDVSPIYQGFSDSSESLKDGKIDAAFIVAGAPTNAITDLATSKPVYLVGFDEEYINKLIELSPFYSAYTILAGTY